MLGFVRDITAVVLANDGVPCRTEPGVHRLFDMRRYVLFQREPRHCLTSNVHGRLLHIILHVDVLDDRLGDRTCVGRSTGGGSVCVVCRTAVRRSSAGLVCFARHDGRQVR